MPEFLLRALAAGCGVAVLAAPFGCFMVWRRMAFFSAAIAHAALLGIAASVLIRIDPLAGILAAALVAAVILAWGDMSASVASDTLLGIVAHAALALGLVLIAFAEGIRIDLMGYLFGDILAATWHDLLLLGGIGAGSTIVLLILWRPLLLMTLDADLAAVAGIRVRLLNLVFMLLLAAIVAVAIRLVGVLLVTALLVMPAATARRFSTTPETMAVAAAVSGIVAVLIGVAGAFGLDTPVGPSIVVAASILFVLVWTFRPDIR